eukprot:TRINITY_DN30_c0_g2_i1.p1 TRINITY_DN30_c0_g2~~TRINITY_DN30_c0_g2_i1.p1  ORF type:complete len:578 (+),score=220.66 TRINITY_DN30_c0_g2_i1:74-1735(+)
MRVAAAVAAFLAGATALEPTKVKVAQTCSSASTWSVNYPATVNPDTPRLNVTVSTASLAAAGALTFKSHGSLGLPNHPLGVFKFSADGPACGVQTAYVKDGVLGKLTMRFPACGKAVNGAMTFEIGVDIWTVLPDVPSVVGTGYQADFSLLAGDKEVLCLKLDMSQPAKTGAEKSQDKCQMAETEIPPYPPLPAFDIPTVTVNLDDPPEKRWKAIVEPRKEAVKVLIEHVLDAFGGAGLENSTVLKLLIAAAADRNLKRMPADFAGEIHGIARATGINVGLIWVMNMMYEVIGLCTSIVAQKEDGTIYHGRNLDFGIFMGTNGTTHNWEMTERLRDILINVQVMKGGKILYNSTTYAGFVGLLSANKGGAFSITVNTRFDSAFDKGLIGWLLGKNNDCQFLTFETRLAMEGKATYTDALAALTSYKPMGPGYIIIGGAAPGEGAVVTVGFGQSKPVDVWKLSDEMKNGSYYILQTNYDRTGPPPGFDDRRYPGENCMDQVTQKGLTYKSLWAVLSSNPTKNALTTFTTLMSPTTGHFEAFKQKCIPGPHCVPF